MKLRKGLSLVLATGILLSGCGVAATTLTAAPAYAAPVTAAIPAPTGVKVSKVSFDSATLTWPIPAGYRGLGYEYEFINL